MTDLTTAATQAGLKDPDLLLVARPDLPPAEAIADLKQRYPGAFPKHARDLSDAEFEAARRSHEWRAAPSRPPAPLITTARERLQGMSDQEFNAAVRRRAWRA
jgi:hypothetical protein